MTIFRGPGFRHASTYSYQMVISCWFFHPVESIKNGAKEHIQVKIANGMAYLGVFIFSETSPSQKRNPNPKEVRKIVDVLAIPYSPVKVIDNMLVANHI